MSIADEKEYDKFMKRENLEIYGKTGTKFIY